MNSTQVQRSSSTRIPKLRSTCFVLDSPVNALVASYLGKESEETHIVHALDHARKDLNEYVHLSRNLLAELNIASEHIIDVNSVRFWGGEKNALAADARKSLAPIIRSYPKDTIYFGNCLTNPVALALKHFFPVNHLYHAPGDFVAKLFPTENPWKTRAKNLAKRVLGQELYLIEPAEFPIFSLLNFKDMVDFVYLDYRNFNSEPISSALASMMDAMDPSVVNVMLLLAGDEPLPGDKNRSNIEKYLKPHFEAVSRVLNDDGLTQATLWIKEHKSYLPLTGHERQLLVNAFAQIGCQVRFVADYLPVEFRSLPGECILRYCQFNYIVAEPSAFLFNVAGTEVTAVAAISAFAPLRDLDQQGRNAEFSAINAQLQNPIRII